MMWLRKSKKGFTLIELMVVVAIIAILALLGLRVYIGQMNKSKNAIVIANASTVHTLIQGDLLDHNYPASETSLAEPGKEAKSVIINIGGLNAEFGTELADALYLANMRNPFVATGVIALVGTIGGGNEGEVIVQWKSPNYFHIQGIGAGDVATGEILRATQ